MSDIWPQPTDNSPSSMYQWAKKLIVILTQRVKPFSASPGTIGLTAAITPDLDTLPADGTVYKQAAFPALYRAIGATFNTGGEAADEFRVPDLAPPPTGFAGITFTVKK